MTPVRKRWCYVRNCCRGGPWHLPSSCRCCASTDHANARIRIGRGTTDRRLTHRQPRITRASGRLSSHTGTSRAFVPRGCLRMRVCIGTSFPYASTGALGENNYFFASFLLSLLAFYFLAFWLHRLFSEWIIKYPINHCVVLCDFIKWFCDILIIKSYFEQRGKVFESYISEGPLSYIFLISQP